MAKVVFTEVAIVVFTSVEVIVYTVSVLGGDKEYAVIYTLSLNEFPTAKPKGTLGGKGLYFTVCPESSPNTVIIYFNNH